MKSQTNSKCDQDHKSQSENIQSPIMEEENNIQSSIKEEENNIQSPIKEGDDITQNGFIADGDVVS